MGLARWMMIGGGSSGDSFGGVEEGLAGRFLASTNSLPSHQAYPSPLDPPPIIIYPANPIYALWTLSSPPNSDHPPNLTSPSRGLNLFFHLWQVCTLY